MHANNIKWLSDLKRDYPKSFKGKKVLELGSGSTSQPVVRTYFSGGRYVGVDKVGIEGGNNGVDIVSEAKNTTFRKNSFDTLVCLSMFEHDPDWEQSLVHNLAWIKPGGYIFLCFGAEGNLHHGPEPWAVVPYKSFLTAIKHMPVKIVDAFFEETRYGYEGTPGVFNAVLRKTIQPTKQTLPRITLPKTQPQTIETKLYNFLKLVTTYSAQTIAVFILALLYLVLSGVSFFTVLEAGIFWGIAYIGMRLLPKFSLPQIFKNPFPTAYMIVGIIMGILLGNLPITLTLSLRHAMSRAILDETILRLIFVPLMLFIYTIIMQLPMNVRLFWNAAASATLLMMGGKLLPLLLWPDSWQLSGASLLMLILIYGCIFLIGSFFYKKSGLVGSLAIHVSALATIALISK